MAVFLLPVSLCLMKHHLTPDIASKKRNRSITNVRRATQGFWEATQSDPAHQQKLQGVTDLDAINRLLTQGVSHGGLSGDWIIPQHQKVMLSCNG